ncbi:Indoleamine 2,3-dioxygenase [Smittium culicis]|uniref:Indoleamine 2,3-dioxygenase n=1 Tax=Smittium culicis TaxID=133412 RepID=A0A1R1Y2P1_9FUNG|nr:Indoleamine 2,3-dioxygenase [Smittium culicis]OMJ26876.1 Indoleamine 2,3-dioxygenase [Smittium culicis]
MAVDEMNSWNFMPRSLSAYDVNLVNGFLPLEEPISRLPDLYYKPWEDLAAELVHLQLAGIFRQRVLKLPQLSTHRLTNLREYQRACVILSFLCHSYVWGHNQPAEEILPPCLAIPWCEVSRYVGISPIVTNATVVLWNWRLFEKNASLDLQNLATQLTFTGSIDESWFYLVSTAIEAKSGEMLRSIGRMINASIHDNKQVAIDSLNNLTSSINDVTKILAKMYEKNDPYLFYWKTRQYLAGWENMKDAGLENGIIYKDAKVYDPNGDCNTPVNSFKKFSGGSAAQSSSIQIIDIALGVKHYPDNQGLSDDFNQNVLNDKENAASEVSQRSNHTFQQAPGNPYLLKMREYMPYSHRQFLTDLGNTCNFREYVLLNTLDVSEISPSQFSESINIADSVPLTNQKSNSSISVQKDLLKAYNRCVSALKTFRDAHIDIVRIYIVNQAKSSVNPTTNRSLKPTPTPTPAPKPAPAAPASVAPAADTQSKSPNPASVNGLAKQVDDDQTVLGTGGTDAISFLKHLRDETVSTRL